MPCAGDAVGCRPVAVSAIRPVGKAFGGGFVEDGGDEWVWVHAESADVGDQGVV